MLTELTKDQAKAQAIYMSYMLRKAQEMARQSKEPAFDPQGRLLIDVTPDINEIVKELNNGLKSEPPITAKNPDDLAKVIGITISPKTIVSLDISNTPELIEKFKTTLEAKLIKVGAKDPNTIIEQLDRKPKGSIIALQQEFHFHLALASRVYQQISKADPKQIEKAHQETIKALNERIMEAYAKSLKDAMRKDGTLDIAKLNKSLDKARKEIMPEAHTLLMQRIVANTGFKLDKKALKEAKISLKHLAEATTSTPNDVIHTDVASGLVTLIKGSENTAHNRTEGEQFGHRQLITHSLKEGGTVEVNNNNRIQIRTPSPVVKEGLEGDQAYISDVRTKFATVTKEYDLKSRLSGDDKKPRAFIYNSYTAFNDNMDDLITKNYQTQSAQHILRGAHRYNVNQLRGEDETPVFCFVQNMSVNGFGNTLGYDAQLFETESQHELRRETTLMAEMALMHTLYDTATPEQQEKITQVFNKYKDYLNRSPNRESFFSNSVEGKETIEIIQQVKNEWKTEPVQEGKEKNTVDNAKLALKQLMANNLHMTHEYSKTFQALSVFVEEASIGGCKSGNERAQAINGRVAILDSLNNKKPLPEGMQKISTVLDNLAKGGNVSDLAKELKLAIDTEYNQSGLQTAPSIVSLMDQGASAKVESIDGARTPFTSRNYAEEDVSVMSNLHQTKAGKMQAHKDLTKQMQGAWDGYPKSWWERMSSSPLGKAGAILALASSLIGIGLLISAGVAIYNTIDNSRRKSEVTEKISQAKEEFDKEVNSTSSNDPQFEDTFSKTTNSLSGIPKDFSLTQDEEEVEVNTNSVSGVATPVKSTAKLDDDKITSPVVEDTSFKI